MTRPLYSALLWAEDPQPTAGPFVSGPVPTGFIWVVREIEVCLVPPSYVLIGFAGMTLNDSAGAILYSCSYPYVYPGQSEHVSTRQVLNAGSELAISTFDVGWGWRVSGYVLEAP